MSLKMLAGPSELWIECYILPQCTGIVRYYYGKQVLTALIVEKLSCPPGVIEKAGSQPKRNDSA